MTENELVPSPIATGGGGGHFEQHVCAYALAYLLVGAIPPIMTDTTLAEVSLQTRHMGWRTDDLLLTGETHSGKKKKLAVQVKRNFKVSAADKDCQETFKGFWDDFISDRFNESEDRLAVITLHGTSQLLQTFSSLICCALASLDSEDFRKRMGLEGYLSKKAKSQSLAILEILTDHLGSSPSYEQYWRFLRTLSVLSLDLNTSTSKDEAFVLSLLSHLTCDNETPRLKSAKYTWMTLLELTGRGRPAAKIFRRENLPKDILARYNSVSNTDSLGLKALVEHGSAVRKNIGSRIGKSYELNREKDVISLFSELEKNQVVIVRGSAGSGKSALANKLLTQLETGRPILAFQAVEFAASHIDQTLANAQVKLNSKNFEKILGNHNKVYILIESIERLLEHSHRDAFSQFINITSENQNIRCILTCRNYSVETVCNAILDPLAVQHATYEVSALSDHELQLIKKAVPGLRNLLDNKKITSFVRTPFVLDLASRLKWKEDAELENVRAFRDKCWKELIRVDHIRKAGLPSRREKMFIDIAHRRAMNLRSFVRPTLDDAEAIDALVNDSLIEVSPKSSALYAPAHDVLEDWALIKKLEEQYLGSDNPETELGSFVGGYPALRRGFRNWLGELFEANSEDALDLVLAVLDQMKIPTYFRDDCLVSILLSKVASDFLMSCYARIESGDTLLLSRIIHMLRVACKESPSWLNQRGLQSQYLVPMGCGWEPALRLVLKLIDTLLPEQSQLVLGLVEDWVKQIYYGAHAPPGFTEAGKITAALLSHFDGVDRGETLKRIIKVLVNIPRAVPGLKELLARAQKRDNTDYTAKTLAEIVLGTFENIRICMDYPSQVIGMVNGQLRISENNFQNSFTTSFLKINEAFGLHEFGYSVFSPASALQGPFAVLLRSRPQDAVVFIVDLLNHCGSWYGARRFHTESFEPAKKVEIKIPNVGSIEQWMNQRLYCLYRGISVGPDVLQSALMALEAWLLKIAVDDNEDLESWLIQIIKSSNNVMGTSVVASICIAHPGKAGRAGLALLSCREIIQCDRIRISSESTSRSRLFNGLNPNDLLYEQERDKSNSLEHRSKDLEYLCIQMQVTPWREEVWKIIDQHHLEVSGGDDLDSQAWRIALHRMDFRLYKRTDAADVVSEKNIEDIEDRIYFTAEDMEPDIQARVIETQEQLSVFGRHISLLNIAVEAWRGSGFQKTEKWPTILAEAQNIVGDLDEPEEMFRGGPGIVAAICLRDHFEKLNEGQLEWCINQVIFELHRYNYPQAEGQHFSRSEVDSPDRACASVVSLLVVHGIPDARSLLTLALAHPVAEVAQYAFAGASCFLKSQHKKLIFQCAVASILRGRFVNAFYEKKRLGYSTNDKLLGLFEDIKRATKEVLKNQEQDLSSHILKLDFDDQPTANALKVILEMFKRHSDWKESHEFYIRIANWLATCWSRDSLSNERRNINLEYEARKSVAHYVLKKPLEKAMEICHPLVISVDSKPNDVAGFLLDLVEVADMRTNDCFWDIWQAFADKAITAPWLDELASNIQNANQFLDRIFLHADWNKDVTHWKRLEGNTYRINQLGRTLPSSKPVFMAYSRFLYKIGSRSLPEAFIVVAEFLNNNSQFEKIFDSNTAFFLETLLRRFVYSEPQRLKSNRVLRDSVLLILDSLVAWGSSSAYRMRDDFVTPLNSPINGLNDS